MPRVSYNYSVDISSNSCGARRSDSKVVTEASTFAGNDPLQNVTRFCRKYKPKVLVEKPNSVVVYNKYMGGIGCFDQDMVAYVINLGNKKWWWPIFRAIDSPSTSSHHG